MTIFMVAQAVGLFLWLLVVSFRSYNMYQPSGDKAMICYTTWYVITVAAIEYLWPLSSAVWAKFVFQTWWSVFLTVGAYVILWIIVVRYQFRKVYNQQCRYYVEMKREAGEDFTSEEMHESVMAMITEWH